LRRNIPQPKKNSNPQEIGNARNFLQVHLNLNFELSNFHAGLLGNASF
jgi:hypothetical protein